jgi:hypothetical protein
MTQSINFEDLLPVVRALDKVRFKSLATEHDLNLLLSLQRQFAAITNGRQIPLRPFRTDGCTLSPDYFGKHCCVLHDLAYWLGGTREERLATDLRLRKCTCKKSRLYSEIQFFGVRIGGHPYAPDFLIPNKEFRWGYGWDKCGQPGEPGIAY